MRNLVSERLERCKRMEDGHTKGFQIQGRSIIVKKDNGFSLLVFEKGKIVGKKDNLNFSEIEQIFHNNFNF